MGRRSTQSKRDPMTRSIRDRCSVKMKRSQFSLVKIKTAVWVVVLVDYVRIQWNQIMQELKQWQQLQTNIQMALPI